MINPHSVIVSGDDILLKIGNSLDDRIYKKISKFISQNSKDGKINISNEQLAIIDDIIYKEIKDSDYEENIKKYLALFDEIEKSVSQEQAQKNQLRVNSVIELWGRSDIRSKIIDKTIYDLGQSGIKEVFIKAISEIVRESNYFNLDLESAQQKLKTVLVDDAYTQRYIKQTAMDSLSQFDGAMNDQIRQAYDFKVLNYITNTIETSRPICVHIRDTLGGKITDTQLKQVLNEYCPSGNPSEKKIEYKVHTGEQKTARAGSGMIEGTVFDNFGQLKGGYGCRHRVIWSRK